VVHHGHEELTDKANAEILATRTNEFWKAAVRYKMRAKVLSIDFDTMEQRLLEWAKGSPGGLFIDYAIQTSGSIGGEHRRDLKETVIGAPTERGSVNLNIGQPPQAKGEEAPKRKF